MSKVEYENNMGIDLIFRLKNGKEVNCGSYRVGESRDGASILTSTKHLANRDIHNQDLQGLDFSKWITRIDNSR